MTKTVVILLLAVHVGFASDFWRPVVVPAKQPARGIVIAGQIITVAGLFAPFALAYDSMRRDGWTVGHTVGAMGCAGAVGGGTITIEIGKRSVSIVGCAATLGGAVPDRGRGCGSFLYGEAPVCARVIFRKAFT